jgi:hypothetical protein
MMTVRPANVIALGHDSLWVSGWSELGTTPPKGHLSVLGTGVVRFRHHWSEIGTGGGPNRVSVVVRFGYPKDILIKGSTLEGVPPKGNKEKGNPENSCFFLLPLTRGIAAKLNRIAKHAMGGIRRGYAFSQSATKSRGVAKHTQRRTSGGYAQAESPLTRNLGRRPCARPATKRETETKGTK